MLTIDRLRLRLPREHAARAARIGRLLGEELARLDWPAGRIEALRLPPLQLSPAGSDRQLARRIAQAIHAQVNTGKGGDHAQ